LPTNASDTADAPEPGAAVSAETILDLALEYTFPASDPIAVDVAFDAARKRQALPGALGEARNGSLETSS
jgi:hypothetical protein